MNEKALFFRLDYLLAGISVAIGMIGVLLVSSATHNSAQEGLWIKQLLVLAAGAAAMLLVGLVDYRVILRFAPLIYAAAIAALIVLLVLERLTLQ